MKTENPSLSITPTQPSFIAFRLGSCVSFYPELVCCLSKSNKNKMLTYIHAYEWITNAQSKKDIEQFLSLFSPVFSQSRTLCCTSQATRTGTGTLGPSSHTHTCTEINK